jgi:hypothetical protein
MDLPAARNAIQTAIDRSRAVYRETVFDEWAVVSRGAKKGIRVYVGPRAESFGKDFPSDAEPLRATVSGRELHEGDIEFTLEGAGSKHDVLMMLGANSYLLLNHTEKTIEDLKSNPRWGAVQAILFELSEKFRQSPLEE